MFFFKEDSKNTFHGDEFILKKTLVRSVTTEGSFKSGAIMKSVNTGIL